MGHEAVRERLQLVSNGREVRIGLNLGKNKNSAESSVDDYVQGLRMFCDNDSVDYFVINISSPNTPGLRDLQKGQHLKLLLDAILAVKQEMVVRKPILLKISPDLSHEEREQVCSMVMTANSKKQVIDGIIVSNTTTWRPEKWQEDLICEVGGLSGAPLRLLSTQAIADVYSATRGRLPIIGVGGIFSGDDAFDKVKAGASLLQVYTSVALHGPPVVTAINRRLAHLLRSESSATFHSASNFRVAHRENGFQSVSEAVGVDHKKKK